MEKCSFFLKCRNRGLPAADLQAPVLPKLAAAVPPAIIWPFLSPSLFSKQSHCCFHPSTIPINTLGKHWWGCSVKYELSCACRDLISPFHLWQQMISSCSWNPPQCILCLFCSFLCILCSLTFNALSLQRCVLIEGENNLRGVRLKWISWQILLVGDRPWYYFLPLNTLSRTQVLGCLGMLSPFLHGFLCGQTELHRNDTILHDRYTCSVLNCVKTTRFSEELSISLILLPVVLNEAELG